MPSAFTLFLATSIWGFTLQPPASISTITAPQLPQVRAGMPALTLEDEHRAAEVARNNTIMDWTRGMELAGTISLAVTAVFGAIQFGDEYGFHGDYSQTACANGDPVFDYCGRSTPVPHLTAAGVAAATGLTAFILSTQVNFDLAAAIDGDWRTFEVTRWVGLGMTVAQAILGFFVANSIRFGWLNEVNDFDTLQGLAAGHLALGVATLALETYNTILLF